MTVNFMTTEGCHLCDQAWSMIEYLLKHESEIQLLCEFNKVEISDKDELIEQYGTRIPVLKSPKGELGWPFGIEELVAWLKA